MVLFRLILRALPPYRSALVAVGLLQLGQTLAALLLPSLNADVVDNGVVPGDTGYILRTGVVMLVVTVIQAVCASGVVYLAARVAVGVGRDLRAGVFARVQSFSAEEIGRFGIPSLITRTTNDVQQVQVHTLMTLTMMVMAPIMGVGAVLLALRQDVPLSMVLLLAMVVLGVAIAFIVRRSRQWFRRMQEHIDDLNRILREQITGVRVIRAFVRDNHERQRFRAANEQLQDASLRVGRLMTLMLPTVMLVMNGASVAVLWFGGQRIDAGDMQVGALSAFLNYLTQVLVAIMMAMVMIMVMPRAEICAERITDVLSAETTVTPPATPVTPRTPRGEVVLRDVTFRYPGANEPVLSGITMTAGPGRTTAIIGGTGSGKTTLVNLLCRLLDSTAGSVSVDGVDVRDLDPAVLAATIGLVPQKAHLFTGTVAANLRYGRPDATEQEMWHALEVAQAREFVARMPAGLHTPIAQDGTTVSGGQRQRLAIARAVVHRPAVYLFDDCFSALDHDTEARLRDALAAETADATVIIVAQRVHTIRSADHIVVVDDGRVTGAGTHEELLDGNTTYREILLSQELV
ncbi:ABC transporter ATP-binding protein [Kibdelosporangium lantanae]